MKRRPASFLKRYSPWLALALFLFGMGARALAAGEPLCRIPPFVAAGVKPNVIIMFDNSGSMKEPMYNDPSFSGWKCSQGTHADFDPGLTYYGLFDSSKTYTYDPTVPVDPDPWDGDSGDPYNVTVNTTVTGAFVEATCTPGVGTDCWDGNFLNWLVTRRADAARKALVGGKTESRQGDDYDGDGHLEWKVLGNNEPSDGSFCKESSYAASHSPFSSNAVFTVYSPADSGNEGSYDPYAKLNVTDALRIRDKDGNEIGEIGSVQVNHQWSSVNLAGSYSNPIVVAGPMSFNGSDPSVVRIRNVTGGSFEIRVQEFEYRDGNHTKETIYYMVIEKGSHLLPGNHKVIAGLKESDKTLDRFNCGEGCCTGSTSGQWETVTFSPSFDDEPVVLASVVTEKDGTAVTVRMKDVESGGFDFALQEEEKLGPHGTETVHYVALEQGEVNLGAGFVLEVGIKENVHEAWETISFDHVTEANYFLAAMQTTQGEDTAVVRFQGLTGNSVEVQVYEEKSCDSEISHDDETIGYVVIQAKPEFNIAVLLEEEPTGIVQDVAGKVRLGVSFYRYEKDNDIYNGNSLDGGTLNLSLPLNPFVEDGNSISYRTLSTHVKATVEDVVDAIEHYPLIWGTTPLAENYYELIRYVQQTSPHYDTSAYERNNDWDPYYFEEMGSTQECAKTFIVVFTDGEPWKDFDVPSLSGCSGGGGASSSDTGPDCDGDGNEPKRTVCDDNYGTNGAHDYLDDLAYWAHQNDLRSDLPGFQNLVTYSVIFGVSADEECFTYGDPSSCAAAGCVWQNDLCIQATPQEQCRQAIMQDTADNGGGQFYYASDADQLYQAFFSIFEQILRTGSAGAVATVTQQVLGEDLVVRGAFEAYSPEDPQRFTWKGQLEAYWPYDGCATLTSESACNAMAGCTWQASDSSCTGKIYSFQLPDNNGKFCGEASFVGGHCWNAARRMPSPDERSIFTFDNGTTVVFDDNNTTALEPYLENDIDFDADGDLDSDDTRALINWVRGDTTYEGTTARDRDGWALGDIVFSTPVVVGKPSLAAVPPAAAGDCSCTCVQTDGTINEECAKKCFYCYRYKHQYRDEVVYAAANDGMLHAFLVGVWDSDNGTWQRDPDLNSGIGRELWAYIPSSVLPELKDLANPSYGTDVCQHRFVHDLSPMAWDVFIKVNGEEEQWRTVLIGGQGSGGDTYYAIDITDPHNPTVLWEYPVLRNLTMADNGTLTQPFAPLEDYEKVKNLPYSLSTPYVGRLSQNFTTEETTSVIGPLDDNGTRSFDDYGDWSGWVAFIGGGGHVFSPPDSLTEPQQKALAKPYLLALDVETGRNLFQSIWARMLEEDMDNGEALWPQLTSDNNTIPYTMTGPLVLDLLDAYNRSGQDGYVDHLYLGDLNGGFYRFRLGDNATGMDMELRYAKDGLNASNIYRSERQPLTSVPVAALDSEGALRLYFGTGKFAQIRTDGRDDRSDNATMSFYGLRQAIEAATPSGFPDIDLTAWTDNCTNFETQCSWITDNGTPDSCQSSPLVNPCWTCVYDLHLPGERVVDQPLVAGEVVLFTSFVPSSDRCSAGGDAYLYALDYSCGELLTAVFDGSGFTKVSVTPDLLADGEYTEVKKDGVTVGYVAKIGSGMPSRPVLDSSGRYVLIQTSDARIHRIRVQLPQKPLYLKGWKEEVD